MSPTRNRKPKKTTKFMVQAQSLYFRLLSITQSKKIFTRLIPILMDSVTIVAIV